MAYFDFFEISECSLAGGVHAVHHAKCLKSEEAFNGSDGMALLCDIQHKGRHGIRARRVLGGPWLEEEGG